MAKSFNVNTLTRSDKYHVDPTELVVDQVDRGRFIPPTEEAVMFLAHSIFKNGQQVPSQCRRTEDDGLKLTLGFTRHAACMLIREGFSYNGEKIHDPEFLLQIVVDKSANEQVAFVHNIVENAHRNATSPIDDAYNQLRLRDRYGFDDKKICELYGASLATVQRLEKLLQLSNEHQEMVHRGELAILPAMDLLQVPEKDRNALIDKVKADTGKLTGRTVRSAVRDLLGENYEAVKNEDEGVTVSYKRLTAAEKASGKTEPKAKKGGKKEKKPKRLARTVKEIREFFQDRSGLTTPAGEFAHNFVIWANGEMNDAAFQERFEAFTQPTKSGAKSDPAPVAEKTPVQEPIAEVTPAKVEKPAKPAKAVGATPAKPAKTAVPAKTTKAPEPATPAGKS